MQTVTIGTTAVSSKCQDAVFVKARDTQFSITVEIEESEYQTITLRLEGMVLAKDRSSKWQQLTSSTNEVVEMQRLRGIPSNEVTLNNGYIRVNTRCMKGPVSFRLKLVSKRYIEQLGDSEPNVRTLYRINAFGTTHDAQVEQVTTNGVIFQRVARDVTGVDKKFAKEIATQFDNGVECTLGETFFQRRERIAKHFYAYPSDSIDIIAQELGGGVAPAPRKQEPVPAISTLKRRHSEVALCTTPDSSCMQKNKIMLLSNETTEERHVTPVYTALPHIELLPTFTIEQLCSEECDFFAQSASLLDFVF